MCTEWCLDVSAEEECEIKGKSQVSSLVGWVESVMIGFCRGMAGGGVLEQMLSSILNMLSSGAYGTKGRWPMTLVTIKSQVETPGWKL